MNTTHKRQVLRRARQLQRSKEIGFDMKAVNSKPDKEMIRKIRYVIFGGKY